MLLFVVVEDDAAVVAILAADWGEHGEGTRQEARNGARGRIGSWSSAQVQKKNTRTEVRQKVRGRV